MPEVTTDTKRRLLSIPLKAPRFPTVNVEGVQVPSKRQFAPEGAPQAGESALKDIWDTIRLAGANIHRQTLQYTTQDLPDFIFGLIRRKLATRSLNEPKIMEEYDTLRAKVQPRLDLMTQAHQDRFDTWLEEHPEVQPREEWQVGLADAIKNKDPILQDPGYWAAKLAQSAIYTLVGITAFTVGTVATGGNIFAGAAAAGIVITPALSHDLNESLIEAGATREEAAAIGVPIGLFLAAIEQVGNLPLLSQIAGPFKRTFMHELTNIVTRTVFQKVKTAGLAITVDTIAEALTEGGQEIVSNATLQMFDENRELFDNVLNAFTEGGFIGGVFGVAGGAATTIGGKARPTPTSAAALEPEVVDTRVKRKETPAQTQEEAIEKGAISTAPPVEVPTDFESSLTAEIIKGQRKIPTQPAPEVAPTPKPATEVTQEIIGRVRTMYTETDARAVTFREELKGKKGEEATRGRQSLRMLEKELESLQRVIKEGAPKDIRAKRQLIGKIAGFKGLTKSGGGFKSQLQKAFVTKLGTARVTSMTPAQLDTAAQIAWDMRPNKIRGAVVIKEATDRAIKNIKATLLERGEITIESYDRLLNSLNMQTDTYVNDQLFITERQGRDFVIALNTETEVGRIRRDTVNAKNLEAAPAIAKAWGKVVARMKRPAERAAIQDKKVGVSSLWDMFPFVQKLHMRTGVPIYDVFRPMADLKLAHEAILDRLLKTVKESSPEAKHISTNEEALERVRQVLAGEEHEASEAEVKFADELRKGYKLFESWVRYHRTKNSIKDALENDTDEAVIAQVQRDFNEGAEIREDLIQAINLYKTQGLQALRAFTDTKTWGVIDSNFDPRFISNPELRLYDVPVSAVTKERLHKRTEGFEFAQQDKNVLQRYSTAIRQYLNLELEPYFDELNNMYKEMKPMLKNSKRVKAELEQAIREIRGYSPTGTGVEIAIWLGGMSFSIHALNPSLFVRNLAQNPALHPDFIELFNIVENKALTNQEGVYSELLVNQRHGISRDLLLQEGLGNSRLSRFVKALTYYPKSDQLNRHLSMNISLNKGHRALTQYRKDGDIGKFMAKAGFTSLRPVEQKHVLELMATPEVDYNIEGLDVVSGEEAAVREIARKVTERVHLNYRRWLRSPIEQGDVGRTLFSLFTFPRGVGQNIYELFEKLSPSSGASTSERMRAGRSILMVLAGVTLAGQLYFVVTGKADNPYNLLNILSWGPGGLVFGSMQAIGNVVNDIVRMSMGDEQAASRLTRDLPTAVQMFVPFFKQIFDMVEVMLGEKYVDRKLIRQTREFFDENYKMQEKYYEQERTLIDSIQHFLFGTDIEAKQERLEEIEGRKAPVPSERRVPSIFEGKTLK